MGFYTIPTVLIDTVAELKCHYFHSDLPDCPSRVQCSGKLLCALELTLNCRKSKLNWIELGTVGWKVLDLDLISPAYFFDSLASVYRCIIQY